MNKNLVGYNNEIHPCQVDIRSIHFPCMRILVQLSPLLPVQLLGACTELLPFVSSASHSLMLSDTLRAVLFPGLRNPIELEKSLGGNMGRRFLVRLSKSFSLSQHVTLQSWKWAGFYRKAPSWAALLRSAPGYWKRNETHWRRQEPRNQSRQMSLTSDQALGKLHNHWGQSEHTAHTCVLVFSR